MEREREMRPGTGSQLLLWISVVSSIILSVVAILLVNGYAKDDDQRGSLATILSFAALCDIVAGCLLFIYVPGLIGTQRMAVFIWAASLACAFYFGVFEWSRGYLIAAIALKFIPLVGYGCGPREIE